MKKIICLTWKRNGLFLFLFSSVAKPIQLGLSGNGKLFIFW